MECACTAIRGSARVRPLHAHVQIIRAEGIIPHRRGAIAGVARSGPVVARQQFFADAQLLTHLLQRRIRQCHRSASTFQRDGTTAGASLANRACWPVSIKNLRVFHGVCCKVPWPKFKMCLCRLGTSASPASHGGSSLPARTTLPDRHCPAGRFSGPASFRSSRNPRAIDAQDISAGSAAARAGDSRLWV